MELGLAGTAIHFFFFPFFFFTCPSNSIFFLFLFLGVWGGDISTALNLEVEPRD